MFAVVHCYALACLQLVQRFTRELAVGWKLAYRKVHIAIAGLVGQTFVLQGTNHRNHLRHVVHGAWL